MQPKMKDSLISIFLCKFHISDNSALQVIGHNFLVESDWSLISLERKTSLIDYLHGDIHKGNISVFNNPWDIEILGRGPVGSV